MIDLIELKNLMNILAIERELQWRFRNFFRTLSNMWRIVEG